MTIQTEVLEMLYHDFVRFLATKNETFEKFASSSFIRREENYKYEVYEKAKEQLEQKGWEQGDWGTGKIQEKVKKAIKVKNQQQNNLVDWRKQDDFTKLPVSRNLEMTLFNFYKNKTRDSETFDEFLALKLSYQLIAYLYFIKDRNRYLPIAQERFDQIFELIGISEFKTSGNASWENYTEYIAIVKQVHNFLKTKDRDTTLLDAHSFLYVLGSQMQKEKFPFSAAPDTTVEKQSDNGANSLQVGQEQHQFSDGENEAEISLHDRNLAEELPKEILDRLFEGAKKVITINAYERNEKARQRCIDYWKSICTVCEFDFEEKYGDIGKGFIHVHHLIPLSQVSGTYEVDPINDLRPVCPNCHAMLHRQKETLTIERLKSIIKAK